jgi:hypothetical protein
LDTPNLTIKNKSAKNKNKKEFTIDVKLIKKFKYSSIFNSEEKDRNPKLLSEKLKSNLYTKNLLNYILIF